MRDEKTRLRHFWRGKLRALDAAWRLKASGELAGRLAGLKVWRNARVIGLFAGRDDEMETALLWSSASEGKTLLYPKMIGDELHFLVVDQLSTLQKGAWEIHEPSGDEPGEPDLLLVPGLAFDADGGRLGRGKGFYDRWLAAHPSVLTLGICFELQIIDEVPMEAHDRKMDGVVTESSLYKWRDED